MKIKSIIVCLMVAAALFGCKSNKGAKGESEMTDAEKTGTEVNPFLENAPTLQDPIEIAFGDFEGMTTVSKKAQNGEYVNGQIVTIEGELSVNPGSVSIGQRNVEAGEYIGTMLQVTGWTEDDYPEDGSRVKVKATMKQNPELWFFYLVAAPEDFTVISGPEE
ncbi:MAG: hypothetical protein IKN25_07725 [Spirochaetales bacterium]|nr:hypothetical protein [Spirochaetales bacterium]